MDIEISLILITNEELSYENKNVGDIVCYKHIGYKNENGEIDTEDQIFAGLVDGFYETPNDEFQIGDEDDEDIRYTYGVIVPAPSKTTPLEYLDFSIILDYLNNSSIKETIDGYLDEYEGLIFIYSKKKETWLCCFGEKNRVLDDLFERDDLENSYIIDHVIDHVHLNPSDFNYVAVPNDVTSIEIARKSAGITKEEASALMGEDRFFWDKVLQNEVKISSSQWNIFLNTLNLHTMNDYHK